MDHQDWKPLVLKKTGKALEKMQRNRGETESVKKYGSGGNAQQKSENLKKIEDETETFRIESVSHDLKVKIQQARTAKKLSQKDLANKMNVNVNVIQDYENGKAKPDPQMLNKMSRILGVPISNKKKKPPK
jgi:putative transcription factor